MSYATALKSAMCQREPEKNCCRRAYLNGFLITNASHTEKNISVKLSGGEVRNAFLTQMERQFHVVAQTVPCRGGGDTCEISFASTSASSFLDAIDRGEEIEVVTLRCKECRKWFLRGIFLSCGNPSDPGNSFRLDLTPRYRVPEIAEYLTSIGLKPLVATRRAKQILFYRSGEIIGDMYGMMGENEAYFELQNEFFKKELNNLTNRQNNCMISNIMRSVKRGGELIDLLTRMKEQNKLSLLPPDLKSTAELRLSYPDYTLPQLAAVSVPPLTKSGLNHRLRRILEIARKLDL